MSRPAAGSGDRASIELRAHAKVNLSLRVLALEEGTGYHQLETVFCRLQLADSLVFEPAPGGFHLVIEGADLGDPRDNLVARAANAFAAATGLLPAHRVRLTKRIPAGAGLGGGSSDAAATLFALNRIHGRPLGMSELHGLACRLGADVPFFLSGAPLALGWGRGDRLLALPALPEAAVLIVVPETPIATAEAYRALSELREPAAPPSVPLTLAGLSSWRSIGDRAVNDFERVTHRWIPGFDAIRARLREIGATFARLAGSGSAVFGLFEHAPPRDAVRALQAHFPDTVILETRTAAGTRIGVDPPSQQS